MTVNLSLLCNFVEKYLGTVRFGNDQFAPILGYGDLVQGNITIKRVYYVEGLNHNLFSVGQFCDADLEVAFRKSTCFVRDLQGNDLLTGNRGTDLYIISLQETTSSTPICLMAKASPTQAWLWHQRLSHLNFDYINLLSKKDVVIGLPKLKYVKDQLCSSCEVSKAKRSSFKSKTVPSSKGRLNLLHMDLCGPMRVASINGKKYILVIVDDYSRYTWTLFLRSKDETPEVLKDFLTMIQRNLQAPVISVRTDRGTEFLNKTLNAFFKEEGIEHQTSTPRTPEQNGVVERRNRTLVEAARTMLSASKLPLFFWAEAIATACYTQNRSIIIPTHEKTAYHIINDRKPSIKHLHIFGCTCYLTRDGENLDKMKEKGDSCILVGYSTQSKGYRVYNKRTRLIVESIHLRFDEIKEISETSVANDTSGLVPQRQKASDYDNPDPAPELQNVFPSADTTVPSQQELDLLFGPLYDEFFNDGTSRVNKSSSPTDNSAPQDTNPSTNIHPTSEPTTPTNVHAEENNDDQAEFTNPFCTPVQEAAESSSRNLDVNARTKKPNVVPISTRKPKSQANKSVATPHKKTVASESTTTNSKSYYRMLYKKTSKAWKWWIAQQCPSAYTWVPKTKRKWVPKVRNESVTKKIVQLILFIVDSGCTKHMTGNLSLLCNFVEKYLGTVRFGNDQFAPILGYGDLVQGNITIKRVYYVEGLNHNLFSVGQFCDADLEVAFRKSTCFVRDLQGNDLLTGNRGTDLYTISLQETTSSTPICLMAKASPTQAWLWHRRLSHLNFDYINLLSKKDVVIGLPKLKYVKDQLCSSCEVCKAKRSTFKSKTVPSSKGRLNLLHVDLCGPMQVASINGKKYILVIVDDYSRYTWTLFLRSKDETPEVLKDFLTMIQRNLQAPVISVCTDRGTEFLNKTLHAFFKDEEIEHQTSTPRTPEQNDVMKEKGDPCILVGYSTQSKGYHVYNKKTRLIVESIHLRFDEIKEMSETSVANDTSGLELDLLFGPLYDEFFNDGTSRVNKSSSPTDDSTQQDTLPSTNIHPTTEPSTPTHVNAEENNNDQAEFTNPFCTPVQEIAESSSRNIGTSNMHTFNQPQDSEYRWTKDHPLTQVRGNPSKPVQTRRQLATDPEMCMFALTVSIVEPKNIKEAMADSAWIEAMQEELHQFDTSLTTILIISNHSQKALNNNKIINDNSNRMISYSEDELIYHNDVMEIHPVFSSANSTAVGDLRDSIRIKLVSTDIDKGPVNELTTQSER
ncbi:retrovirus-related pol polyprotein from transposon TNT 1-94 [Tanacetum coccineum]